MLAAVGRIFGSALRAQFIRAPAAEAGVSRTSFIHPKHRSPTMSKRRGPNGGLIEWIGRFEPAHGSGPVDTGPAGDEAAAQHWCGGDATQRGLSPLIWRPSPGGNGSVATTPLGVYRALEVEWGAEML